MSNSQNDRIWNLYKIEAKETSKNLLNNVFERINLLLTKRRESTKRIRALQTLLEPNLQVYLENSTSLKFQNFYLIIKSLKRHHKIIKSINKEIEMFESLSEIKESIEIAS